MNPVSPFNAFQLARSVFAALILAALTAAPTASAEPLPDDDWITNVAFTNQEAQGMDINLWSPVLVERGAWKGLRAGIVGGVKEYYVRDAEGKRDDSPNYDVALGILNDWSLAPALEATSSVRIGFSEYQTLSLEPENLGHKIYDNYWFADVRQGLAIAYPAVEGAEARALNVAMEIGVGLRLNFINNEDLRQAGSTEIQDGSVYPYWALNFTF